jgi:hypothetical protein
MSRKVSSRRTVIVVDLARALEIALDDIVSREEFEDNRVTLNSADGLRNKDETGPPNLDGMHGSRGQRKKSRRDVTIHLGLF